MNNIISRIILKTKLKKALLLSIVFSMSLQATTLKTDTKVNNATSKSGLLYFIKKNKTVSLVAILGIFFATYALLNYVKNKKKLEKEAREKEAREKEAREKKAKEKLEDETKSDPIEFDAWKREIDKKPCYKKDTYTEALISKENFIKTILEFIEVMKKQLSSPSSNWFNAESAFLPEDFSNDLTKIPADKFYLQKLDLPSDAEIYMHGDIHADAHSLIKYLSEIKNKGVIDNNFKIQGNRLLVFLGDYTDRGNYGVETLYTLMRLKIENPEKVVLLRGNHEDWDQNIDYGFMNELRDKYNDLKYDNDGKNSIKQEYINLVTKFYNLMPSALFTCILPEKESDCKKYSLLCHAGIEPRYNPNKLLSMQGQCVFQKLDKLNYWAVDDLIKNYLEFVIKLKEENITTCDIGFLWNDFQTMPNIKFDDFSTRGTDICIISEETTKDWLKNCKSDKYMITNIFKGHQHMDDAFIGAINHNGIFNIREDVTKNQWNGKDAIKLEKRGNPVWFLNTGPDSVYRKYAYEEEYKNKYKEKAKSYEFDTHCVLKKKKDANELVLEPCKVDVLDENGDLIL